MGSSDKIDFDFKTFEGKLVTLGQELTTTPDPTDLFEPAMLQAAFPGMTAKEWRGYFSSDAEAQAALTDQSTKVQVVNRVLPGITKEELQGSTQTKAIGDIAELIAEAILVTNENPQVIEAAKQALIACPDELVTEILGKAQMIYSPQ